MTHHSGRAGSLLQIGLVSLLVSVSAATGQQTPAAGTDVVNGKALYENGGCFNCHGDQGQGGASVDFPQGPSLRASTLERDSMIEIVSCGIPNTRMPGWLKGAYTEVPCYGQPLGPAPEGMTVPGAFSGEQIEALVDYIRTEFMKQ